MTLVIVDRGHSERAVYRASRLWAVIPSRKGVAMWKKQGGIRKGMWWPVHSIHESKQSARVAISDAVANREWPKGWLVAVPATYADSLRDGIFT